MTKSILKDTDPKTIFIASAAVVGLLAAPFFSLVTFIAAVVLFAAVAMFNLGILARLAVAVLFCAIGGAALLQVGSALHVGTSFALIHALLLGVAVWYTLQFKNKINWHTSAVDVLGLLVGVATFVVVAFPLFGATMSKTLDYLIAGEDNNSHFQMYRYVVTEGRYAYHNPPDQAGMRPSLLSYAQGSHGAMAVVTAPVAGQASPGEQLTIYAFSAAAAFALTFWLAFLVVALPLAAIKDWRVQSALGSVLAFLYVVGAPLGMFLSLYTYGYFPQYFSYLSVALLLLVVMATAMQNKDRSFAVEVAVLLAGFYAVFASWYLIAPIAAVVLLGYGWVNRKELLRRRIPLLVLAVPAALLCLHLAYVFIKKSNGVGHLLTPGGVEKMDMWVLLVSVPAIVVGAVAARKKQWLTLGFSLSVVVAAAIAALIGYYQKKMLHHFDYYFYKTLFTVIYAAVIYYGYLFVSWLAEALGSIKSKHLNGMTLVAPAVGIIVLCLVATVFNPPKYLGSFFTIKYALPQQANNRALDVFTDNSLYGTYSDIIVLSSCNPYTNFTGTIWAGGFFLPYNVERQLLENSLLSRVPELSASGSPLLSEIAAYAASKDKPVAVVFGELCQTENGLQNIATIKNVTVIAPAL